MGISGVIYIVMKLGHRSLFYLFFSSLYRWHWYVSVPKARQTVSSHGLQCLLFDEQKKKE